MRYFVLIGCFLLLGCGNGYPQTADPKYSNKDFTGQDLTMRTDMSGIIIEGSCFSHETPNSDCFPPDMTGTTFVDSNLDNCIIPPGNVLVRGSNRRFEAQEDGKDYIVDQNNEPVIPL